MIEKYMQHRKINDSLNTVSWDFENAQSNNGPHQIHPYPAKFISSIPSKLIDLFHPGDDSTVFDPFCGSGTTLVEAVRKNIPAVGIDLHPLATLISTVKTTPLPSGFWDEVKEVIVDAQMNVQNEKYIIPKIPRLDHWFEKDIQIALSSLIERINKCVNRNTKNALKVAFSSIVVRVSNQESDTRYAAIKKNVSIQDVWKLFERAAKKIENSVQYISDDLFRVEPRVSVLTKDILRVKPDEIGAEIGLVITSPPYPNAYEYWLYHKYRMYWLGMDPIAVRENEIGARPHYFKKNGQTEIDFERQMEKCFNLLQKVLKINHLACFVVGRSIIHGREIDNVAILERASAPNGFQLKGQVNRKIARNRKSFNLSHGTIHEETIAVFQLVQK